jgi:hypothetical protein
VTRSDGFFVDPDALSAAKARVGDLLDDLGDNVAQPAENHRPDAFGNDELARSVGVFAERWQDGVQELTDDARSFHDRLGETADHYRRLDDNAAAAFDRIRTDRDGDRGE